MQDRELAAEVRKLTLEGCKRALLKKKGKMYEAVLLKLAGTILPRLNEHSGPDGNPIPLLYALRNNTSDQEDRGTKEED